MSDDYESQSLRGRRLNELFEALKTSSVFLARVSFKVPSLFKGVEVHALQFGCPVLQSFRADVTGDQPMYCLRIELAFDLEDIREKVSLSVQHRGKVFVNRKGLGVECFPFFGGEIALNGLQDDAWRFPN